LAIGRTRSGLGTTSTTATTAAAVAALLLPLLLFLFHMPQRHHALGLLAFAVFVVAGHQVIAVPPHQRHLTGVVILGILAGLEPQRPVPPIVHGNHDRMIALPTRENRDALGRLAL